MFNEILLFTILWYNLVNEVHGNQIITYHTLNYRLKVTIRDTVVDGCSGSYSNSLGPNWTGLVIPDLDALFFLISFSYDGPLGLGLCLINGNYHWQDKYKTKLLNENGGCEMFYEPFPSE
ncbi:hypothetical protein SNEBB_000397, partial [Seison nebaliae]